jgi:hypothetical protein
MELSKIENKYKKMDSKDILNALDGIFEFSKETLVSDIQTENCDSSDSTPESTTPVCFRFSSIFSRHFRNRSSTGASSSKALNGNYKERWGKRTHRLVSIPLFKRW